MLILAGQLLLTSEPATWAGAALVLGAAVWNAVLGRRRSLAGAACAAPVAPSLRAAGLGRP